MYLCCLLNDSHEFHEFVAKSLGRVSPSLVLLQFNVHPVLTMMLSIAFSRTLTRGHHAIPRRLLASILHESTHPTRSLESHPGSHLKRTCATEAAGRCPARVLRNLASLADPSSFSPTTMKSDPTTQSNYFEIISEHIALDWHVNFDNKTISGSAVHTLRVKEDGVQHVT
jgi:hypothetical protein